MEALSKSTAGAARWLQVGLLLQCLGTAHMIWEMPSSLNSLLFLTIGLPEVFCARIDTIAVVALPLLAVVALTCPRRRLVSLPIFAWFLLDAIAAIINQDHRFSDLGLAARALRYMVPLLLPWLCLTPSQAAITALRLATAAVFLAHGWEAFQHHAEFQDLVWAAQLRANQLGIAINLQPGQVDALLTAMGLQDLLLSLLLLTARRTTWVPFYMAAWGAITACSRTVAWGADGIDDSLLRALNALVPLFLWIITRRAR